MSETRSDVVEEALRVAEEAEREAIALRLLGGVAIRLRAKEGLTPAFEREYADHDWIVSKGSSAKDRACAPQESFELPWLEVRPPLPQLS